MARMHPLDEAIELQAAAPNEFKGATHPAYANMVGPFGGTTAAQLLQSAMLHPERLGEPVALTVNFAAPVADGYIRFVARPVRTNRSTQHWVLEWLQQADGQTQVMMTATALTAAPEHAEAKLVIEAAADAPLGSHACTLQAKCEWNGETLPWSIPVNLEVKP